MPIHLQKGIRHYEGEPLPIGRTFCCRCLAFVIYVPTEINTVHDVFEHLPEYILCHLYDVMDMKPQNIEFHIRMIDRDMEDLATKGKIPGDGVHPAIAAELCSELEGEKERLSNDLDFCKWWQEVKGTPLGDAVQTEIVNLVKQKRSGEETDWM